MRATHPALTAVLSGSNPTGRQVHAGAAHLHPLLLALFVSACAYRNEAPAAQGGQVTPGDRAPRAERGPLPEPACLSPINLQSCGLGACTVHTRACRGDVPLPCTPDDNRRTPEDCDGVDDDCDGVVDNAPGSPIERSVCSRAVAPRCRAPGLLTLGAGRHTITLPVAPTDACPLPYTTGGAVTWHDVVLVRLTARSAVALASPGGGVRLTAAGQAGLRTALTTSRGLCDDGVARGAAVLDAGVYSLQGDADAPSAPLALAVEVLPVPAATPRVEAPSSARVAMSTATEEEGPFDCARHEGVDARAIFLCPGVPRRLTLGAPQGFVAAVESVTMARTCLSVSPESGLTMILPDDALVLVRAMPYAQERGSVFAEVR